MHRAIDLSCRACDACGAMAMGAGLGFPVGDSAPLRFHPQPPIDKTKLKLDREVGVGICFLNSKIEMLAWFEHWGMK